MDRVRPLGVEELFAMLQAFGFAGADVGQGQAPEELVVPRLSQAVLGGG